MPERNLQYNKNASRLNKLNLKSSMLRMGAVFTVITLFILAQTISIPPFEAFNGVVWAKGGVHYMNETRVASRVAEINSPTETKESNEITAHTPTCDSVESGLCILNDEFVDKTLVTAAVAYVPGTPDSQVITGYCTLCRDNTFSPSCAVGRGACSYHSGVEAYNVARYRTVPGTPATQAQPAVYSYALKSYKDSPSYIAPDKPNLKTVVRY